MLRNLWLDTHGGIISTELVLIASLVTAGILGGMSNFSRNISDEFSELGNVVSSPSFDRADISSVRGSDVKPSGTEFYLLNESFLRTEESVRRDELRD